MSDIAYWPSTFLNEITAPLQTPAPVLRALGGPSFVYRTPTTTIWIDPYFSGTPDDAVADAYRAPAIPVDPHGIRLADAVISTHDHVDHCDRNTLLPIVAQTGATCIGPRSSAALMREWGIVDERVTEVSPDDRIAVGDVEIDVWPSHDPGEPHAVTYVLRSHGVSLFVSGDTWRGPALEAVGAAYELDYGLLAFGRTWYMDEEQMLTAAEELGVGTLLPFHWEFWRNHTGDPVRLCELYFARRQPFALKLLLIGDGLELRPRTEDGGT